MFRVINPIWFGSAEDVSFSVHLGLDLSGVVPKNGHGPWRVGRGLAQECVADSFVPSGSMWQRFSGWSKNCPRERREIVDRIGESAIVELRRAPVTLAHTGPRPGVLGSPFAKWLTAINQIRKQDRFVGVLRHASERNESRGCAFGTRSPGDDQ